MIKSRKIRQMGHVARMGEMRNAYNILFGKFEGKRSLGRPRRRWEDNIRMALREIGWKCVKWVIWLRIGSSGGLLWTQVPLKSRNFLTSWVATGFSRRTLLHGVIIIIIIIIIIIKYKKERKIKSARARERERERERETCWLAMPHHRL